MFTVVQWVKLLLKYLVLEDWKILKIIISDRDRKFISKIWHTISKKKDIELLYNTIYYLQSDEQSEQTNQIFEIILYHYIADLKKFINWLSVLLTI